MLIQLHHDDVQHYQKNDQIDCLSKIVIFLVLHEANDSVDNHWVAHVNQAVCYYSNASVEIPIFESYHHSQENILLFLSVENLFNLR